MVENGRRVLLGIMVFLGMHFPLTMSSPDCPLDFSGSNFTVAASMCSNKEERGKCCRYLNSLIAVSVARYANVTSSLGVNSDFSQICLSSLSQTLDLYGVTRNASVFCGLGTKVPVNYKCQGRTTVTQMLQDPNFVNVSKHCKPPLLVDKTCRKCVNTGILYLRNLIGGADNITLSTCRDASYVALASQVDNASAVDIASCFFGVQGLLTSPDISSLHPPTASPSPPGAASPSELSLSSPLNRKDHHYRLTLVSGVGIAVTVVTTVMLAFLVLLIYRKSKELKNSETIGKAPPEAFTRPPRKLPEGPLSMFRKFSYKETKKATDNFNIVIGQGGFGTVYKAQFSDGSVLAVKRMDKVSEQAEDEFCQEIELLARLHHRHLVTLRGFCSRKRQRFIMYEYMANGSLKDHLHTPGKPPLSWSTRIQIAIDVANALEYLHFYCDPPLCHRDIKSSNILLDDSFVAKIADFGLAHASEDGSICFEAVNTEVRGTPGYMDPEYVITQELTEKSDVYSYGVVLLELITARRAVQDNQNLVQWSQVFMNSESRLSELVDPTIADSFDFDQLQTVVEVVKWCTQGEGRARPSIKQVLRLLYECSDPMHGSFVEAVEDEDYEGNGRRRRSKGKSQKGEVIFYSGDGRCLASSSSTSRSYCSRSFLLETGSPPHSPTSAHPFDSN